MKNILCILGIAWICSACDERSSGQKNSSAGSRYSNATKRVGRHVDNYLNLTDEEIKILYDSLSSDGDSNKRRGDFLTGLAATNPRLAVHIFLNGADNLDDSNLLGMISVLAKNPSLTKSIIENEFEGKAVGGDKKFSILRVLARVSCEIDPLIALELVHLKIEKRYQEWLESQVFASLGVINPELAMSEAKSRFSGRELDEAVVNIASGMFKTDLKGAIALLDSISSEGRRATALAQILGQQGNLDYSVVADIIRKMEPKQLGGLLIAEKDHPMLLASIMANDLDVLRTTLNETVLTTDNSKIFSLYAMMEIQKDYPRAAEFIKSLPDGAVKNQIIQTAFLKMAGSDLKLAWERTSALEGGSQESAMMGVAMVAGSQGIENIDLLNLKENTVPGGVTVNFFRGAVSNDVQSVAEYIGTSSSSLEKLDDSTKSSVIKTVVNGYVNEDPAKAFDWIGSLSDSMKVPAMESYAKSMIGKDVQTLTTQLTTMPKNDSWKAGLNVLISELNASDPENAKTWIAYLQQNQK